MAQQHPDVAVHPFGDNVTIEQERKVPIEPFVRFKRAEVEQSIGDRFKQQVKRYPNRLAVKSSNYHLTYAELNRAANQVAQALLTFNGREAGIVALLLETSAPMIISMLGALKAGQPYVPLDPLFPRERNRIVLEDSQATVLVTNGRNLSLAREWIKPGMELLNLDELDWHLEAEDPWRLVRPEDLAYILYTSGSTGRPKGVMQTHRSLLHMILKYTNGIRISAQDRLTLLASGSFAASVSDIYGALLNGAAVFPFAVRESGFSEMSRWLKDETITVYASTSTLFRTFASTLREDDSFPGLRMIKLGGELVTRKDIEIYRDFFPASCILHVSLGSTEMSSIRYYNINKETPIQGNTVPVGYELDDTKILLLDDKGKEVGTNEIGEIAIRSRYLFPGYWRDAESTRRKFLPNEYGEEERTFLTGDLGRIRDDGCLEHLGRSDSLVKIRGYRIELSEIEAALAQHSGVQATATAVWGEGEEQRLVAYWVPRGAPAPSSANLGSFLRSRLPEYMVPSLFVPLDKLPLTPSGKVNRQFLPSPVLTERPLEEYVAPRTGLEEVLVGIWAEVLKIPQLGTQDNFFERGGNSLMAMQVISQVESTFGLRISPIDILEAPTISGFARWMLEEFDRSISPEEVRQYLDQLEQGHS
jgi:amino acid adenylation domain-containing protein